MQVFSIVVASLLAALAPGANALDNGLAQTPPMGYNSWYDWMSNMDEKQLKETADAMVKHGLVDLGYEYFNLDDCWAKGRHPNGSLFADPAHFPSATLKPLADYVHGLGMKFGTYTDRGPKTCAGRPGAQDHEAEDAQTYADWGVDYLKEDSCNAPQNHTTAFEEYGKMRDGLNKTGRPIVFSLCGWENWYAPAGYGLGNLWRIGPDDTNWHGVLTNIDINADLNKYAGHGGWNDPCLLLAEEWDGKLRQTQLQTRAQFSMWAIMASPLLISANVRNMSAMNLETYKNKEVIAVSQDKLGKQGQRVVGGKLSSGGSSANQFAAVAPCQASAAPAEQWELGQPAAGYVKNAGSGKCLNVDDCGNDLIYFSCVTKGSTCSKNFSDMKFSMVGSALISGMDGRCATVGPDNKIGLAACDKSAAQVFVREGATQRITHSATGGEKMCLTTAGSAPAGATNVWARALAGGDIAMAFLNVGPAQADIACDGSCMAAAGFQPSDKLAIRDLWAHTNSTGTGSGITAKAVPADGGVWMIRAARA